MSMRDTLRSWLGRARSGAGDLAQSASIRLDVRGLEGRRNHLLRSIGGTVLKMHREGRGIPQFEGACRELEEVERAIAEKRAELEPKKAPAAEPV